MPEKAKIFSEITGGFSERFAAIVCEIKKLANRNAIASQDVVGLI